MRRRNCPASYIETLEPRQLRDGVSTAYTTSWIGNNFGGGPGGVHVQQDVNGAYVGADGTIFTNSIWDEAGQESASYRDGKIVSTFSGTHGWGRIGGRAIVSDGTYVYITMSQSGGNYRPAGTINAYGNLQFPTDNDTTWYCVMRFSMNGSYAPFAAGLGYDSSLLALNTVTKVNGVAPDESIAGLAIDPVHHLLYASDPTNGEIRVIDTTSMQELAPIALWGAHQLTTAGDGTLWAVQSATHSHPAQIIHLSTSGVIGSGTIRSVDDPTAISLASGGRVLVCDAGPDQDVKVFRYRKGASRFAGQIGAVGGLLAGATPGRTGPMRFYGLQGAGYDAAGNFYAAYDWSTNGGGTNLDGYNPSGKLSWRLQGVSFVDSADWDPASTTDVYTVDDHFTLNYTRPPGKQWEVVGYTVNREKYPQDPRLHVGFNNAWVRRIDGQKFLFLTDMYSSFLAVYRFDAADGETAIPCAFFAKGHENWMPGDIAQPAASANKDWVWVDHNGDGKFDADEIETQAAGNWFSWGWNVDANGNVTRALRENGIRTFDVGGLNAFGVPRYSYADSTLIDNPAPFDWYDAGQADQYRGDVNRADYDASTDTMYLGGYDRDFPNQNGDWGNVGAEIVRIDHWSAGNRTATWRLPLKYNSAQGVLPVCMSVAGHYLFVGDAHSSAITVYDTTTAQQVLMISPGARVGSMTGWLDTRYSITARLFADGTYRIMAEDDAWGKILLYTWTP